MEWWEKVINASVAVAVLAAIALAIVALARWLKPKADEAFAEHMSLIRALQGNVSLQTDLLRSILANQAKFAEYIDAHLKPK